MDNRPIGVMDSGLGGLTAVRTMLREMPNENIIFYGDTKNLPYGSRNEDTIVGFAKQNLGFLLARDVKAVLVACGTISAVALDVIRSMTDIPVVGVIEASAKTAACQSKRHRVAIFATEASIRSHAYRRTISRVDPDIRCCEVACPKLVPLIESGHIGLNDPELIAVLREYLSRPGVDGSDCLILGCTHYPIIADTVHSMLPDVNLIDVGKEAVSELKEKLDHDGRNASPEAVGCCEIVLTGSDESFQCCGELILGQDAYARVIYQPDHDLMEILYEF